MKKRGIFNAQLIEELTKMRHTDRIVICDAGFPVPEGKTFVDVSLTAELPTVEQVFRLICNEILIEGLTFSEGLKVVRPEFYQMLKERFAEHTFEEITSPAFFERVYERDVKLFIRTGDVRPCGNIMLTSASAVPRVFDKYNVEFDNVIG